MALRLQAVCEGEAVWVSMKSSDTVRQFLVTAGQRWARVTSAAVQRRREGPPSWARFEGALLAAEDEVGLFLADKDRVEVGWDEERKSVAPEPVDELEKALSVFFDEQLFEEGRVKTGADSIRLFICLFFSFFFFFFFSF